MPKDSEDILAITDDAALKRVVWREFDGTRTNHVVYFNHPLTDNLVRTKIPQSRSPKKCLSVTDWEETIPEDLTGIDPSDNSLTPETKARLYLAHAKREGFGKWRIEEDPDVLRTITNQ